jgi:hypothetical protein
MYLFTPDQRYCYEYEHSNDLDLCIALLFRYTLTDLIKFTDEVADIPTPFHSYNLLQDMIETGVGGKVSMAHLRMALQSKKPIQDLEYYPSALPENPLFFPYEPLLCSTSGIFQGFHAYMTHPLQTVDGISRTYWSPGNVQDVQAFFTFLEYDLAILGQTKIRTTIQELTAFLTQVKAVSEALIWSYDKSTGEE